MAFTYSSCLKCNQVNRVPAQSESGRQAVCGKCKAELPIHEGINELNGSALSSLVRSSPLPVIADFWAPWCGPCRMFEPTFKKAAEALAGQVAFAKINTEEHQLAGQAYQIRGVPTLIVFRNGLEQTRRSGAMPLETLLGWINAAVGASFRQAS